ncbi:uncharacterized protein C8Q71DRAFT_551279 [Rhodofomes roseus]|uniref:Uncharacterized protein n=1 Tax=Rhodofomes roseus TaxID=34475 RepID=A0ABQ8KJA3_9APHY|nr:uncharacterized protein C8Q71DRAFT_551279 [Rhodofomes roseus]KAH9837594.1 hypothetical protein C8Q71DRAFT_551279 [Rhodofomes roseus]
MARDRLSMNGTHLHGPKDDIWRFDLPSSRPPPQLFNAVPHESFSNQASFLKPNQITASTPPQHATEGIVHSRPNATRITITNPQMDNTTGKAMSMQPTTGEATITLVDDASEAYVWIKPEIIQNSTTIDEGKPAFRGTLRRVTNGLSCDADEVLGKSAAVNGIRTTLQRAPGAGRPTTHQRVPSGSTESSASLESLHKGDVQTGDVRARPRTWANVVATLDQRHGGKWKRPPVWGEPKLNTTGWPVY